MRYSHGKARQQLFHMLFLIPQETLEKSSHAFCEIPHNVWGNESEALPTCCEAFAGTRQPLDSRLLHG